MALPPTIPTSFVPHSSTSSMRRPSFDAGGALGFFAYAILGLSVLAAFGVFGYERFLNARQESTAAALEKEVQAIDTSAVEGAVRLSRRLTAGEWLVNDHAALSQVFTIFESVLPKNVWLTGVGIDIAEKEGITLRAKGVAQNYNALAVASDAIAKDGRMKDVIFSGFEATQDSTNITFSIAGTVERGAVLFSPRAVPSLPSSTAAPSATSTQSTSTETSSENPAP